MAKYCETKDDLIIVRLKGDLDHHVASEIKDEVDGLIVLSRINRIAFDFKNVGFMDSSGIGLIMGRYKKIKATEGEIYVCNLGLAIQRIFKLSGLFKITKHSFEVDHLVNEEVTYEQN
jgi:stage II sporulation protein AA (anti-sigma F factor antagonist)